MSPPGRAPHLGGLSSGAGVRKRLDEIAQETAASQDLATSITLRQALKRTRDLRAKTQTTDNKEVEVAKAAMAAAQSKLDAVIAKQAEHTANFDAEEAKLLEALRKAEDTPTRQTTVAPPPTNSVAAATG